MTISDTEVFKRAEIPPKDLSDEGKCLLAAQEEANATQTYLNMADNTDDEALKANFEEVAGDEMEHLGKNLMSAAHIRPELAEHMINGAQEAESEGFDIDQAIKDRFAKEDAKKAESTDFDEAIQEHVRRSYPSEEAKIDEILYEMFSKAKANGATYISDQFLGWLKDTESFKKAYKREQIGEYDINSPGMQRFRDKIDRDKKYIDKLDRKFNLKEMYDDSQEMYSVNELKQAEKELRDLNKDVMEMSGHINLSNKYNEIQKMLAYNKYIDLRAQIERMEKFLEHVDDLREQTGEYDTNIPDMQQRFRDKIDRDKKYVDMLDKEFNLKEMYDSSQRMYSVKELEQAEKELRDLNNKIFAESKEIKDKDMRDHYNNLSNKYNEIQKMRAYNEYIDLRAQIERMEKLLEHVDDLREQTGEYDTNIPGMQRFRSKIDRDKKYVDKLDKEFNLKEMYDDLQKMYSVKELEQAEKELLDLKKKMLAESKEIKDKDMRDQYNNLLNKYNEIQKMRTYNEYIDVRAQIKRMEKLLEHVDDLSIPGMQQRFRDKIDRDKKYIDKLDKEFNLKKMYDSSQKMYSVNELEQAKKELRDLNKDVMEISGYNKLANKYNEIQKMRAYNKYIGVGAQTERMEKLLELINDFVEKINEAFGDKIDERLANTEGENVYETKWGGDDPEKVIEDYNSVVEEAFKDPDVKEIMDKIGALGFNPRQIITEVLGGSEDMDIEDLLRSRLGSSPESVGKMLRDITESYASGIGQSPEESRKIQEIANRNKGDVYFPESKNKNIYGGVNYNRLGVKSDPRLDALATIMAEVENSYKARKYGGKTTPIDRETFTPGQKHRQMAFDLMSILGYLFDENDPIRIFDRSKGSKYDLSNLDLLTNKDDTYQKIANEIESAMKGAKKDRLWALMKDPVQPSSLDSIQKWSVGDGMNLGMGWVRDAIYKFAEDIANGNIDLPIPKNKPEGETGERYESAKKAVDELKAGEPMTYGRMQDILGYEATGDAFVNSLNDSNMFGTALNVIRSQLYDEVEKFIGSDGTKRDLLVEKSLPDSNVRDRYLAIMDAIRRKVASKNHLKSFPSLRDVLDAVYEFTTNDIKRQRIPSNISDFRKVTTLKDKFKNIVDALTAYSSFENISGLKSTYDELENGVNSLGYKSQKNKKNTKQLRDILDIISKPNFTLSDLSEDQMNYLKIHDIIGSDEGETAEDFKKNLIRKVKNAIANSNAEYLLKENKSNLEYVLRTVLGSKGAKLFTELIKIANDKNYLDALDEFERTGSTKKYGWDKSIQVPLEFRDGKTISVPLYEVLNSGLMQNFDKIYDTVMAAVGPVDKNNPVYEGDNSMLMNILQRNKLRRDDKKYVNESNKDRFGYIPHPGYEGKNLDKGEIFALYNDPEKRDEFPLSKKFKAEEYLPSYLRLKGSDLSMSDEFLSSLVFRNRKFSPEEIARITTSDFNTRHIRDIADALSKGQELNETDKALVKLFGIGDMGFESLSNLVKNIDSNTFKKYEESIKKNGYKSVIEDLENKSKTDKSVVEDLELLKATYELINKARNIDDDVRAIYEESVDDFEKRLNEAGESIYEILGSEGAYDKLVQMGEKLYTDFQKEVDYSEDLKKRKTEGDKIKFLERAGAPIGYKDRTGDIKYFKQGDATQADLQRYFNEMYKNYLDDVKNTGLRDRLNEYNLHEDQDGFVPIKGWSDSSMRLTKKHPLRNISVANALTSAMGWEDLDPTKLVMSNKWLKDVDPDRDEISIVNDILDGYVDYFSGDVKSEPKSLLNSLWDMGDNIPPEIEALDANDRAIEEMNESNEKDNTDQEGEDERYDSLEDLIASNLQARINNARGERVAQQKKKSYEEAIKGYEKDKKKQEENNGAKEGVDKMNDETEATTKSAAKIMNVEGAKTRILDSTLDSEGIHTGKVFPSWQKDSYVISMCDPNVENIPPKPPEISNAQPEGATMKTWDIDEAIKERQK